MSRPRLLLDTNIWIYVADAQAVELVRRNARDSGVDVLACPAVAIEMLNYRDRLSRKRRLQAITRGCWPRLMPEVYSGSQEFLTAVRMLRPQWLRNQPSLQEWYRLRADWQGNWWIRMRRQADREIAAIEALGGDERLSLARDQARAEREDLSAIGVRLEEFDPDDQVAVIPFPLAGWAGGPVERWRAEGLLTWTAALSGERLLLPYLQWVEPWMDTSVASVGNAEWVSFWMSDITKAELPRWVMRIQLATLQGASRYSNGTPGDNQIGPYLIDADAFVTADKPFARVLKRLTELVDDVPLPAIHQVHAGADGIQQLIDLIGKRS